MYLHTGVALGQAHELGSDGVLGVIPLGLILRQTQKDYMYIVSDANGPRHSISLM